MRHFTRDRSPFRVRLACVKHAASVQSEPESNSPVQICSKDLRWTEIRISKFLPVRYSLVNEPHRFTRREAVVYAASFSLSTSFFYFRESFFRGPVGATRWREGDLCLIFKPASRTFLPSGKISFPVALSDVASSLARTPLCAFSTPPSSIFPQKNFVDLFPTDCLFNQHTEITQKNACIFLQAISFPRAQGLPIESGRNHRSACFQQSLLPAVFPTFPCDTNIPGYMALTLSLYPGR